MSKVAITKSLLDDLADAIGAKTGETTPMTIADMTDAVEAITLRSGTDLSASGATVTVPAGLYSAQATKSVASGTAGTPTATKGTVSNHSVSVTPSVTNTSGYITGSTKTGTAVTVSASELVSGTKSINANGTGIDVTEYAAVDVAVPSGQPSLQTKTRSYTPSETAQSETVSADVGYDGLDEVSVSVGAISSTYVGSGITRRDSTDLSAIGATVSVPSGYYANSASKAVSNGSATAPATITGSSATVSTGTNTLTLTKSVSVTPSVTAGYVSAGTAGNSSVSLTASVTTQGAQTLYPSTTDQTITGSKYLTGTQTFKAVTTSNLTADNIKSGVTVTVGDSADADRILSVTGTYSGGGDGMTVSTETTTLSTASSSIQFTGLSGQPTSFVVTTASDLATGASPYKTAAVVFDGTNLHGQIVTNTSNANASYSASFTQSYSSGTLTITGSGTNFQANQYKLIYTYGGTSANIGTAETQVGSGATSITFTGLSDDPDYFSVIFKSDFGTSSGYQRVMSIAYDGVGVYGVAMDSGAKAEASWSYTYNNGSLTVTSTSTSNGGYFHQPGYYQLTYGVGGTVEPTEIEVEPLSVTQNGTYTAPAGKAYSPVTVNVSGGGGASVATTTWTNSSTSTVSHQFTGLSGTPKAAFLRCTSQLTRSSSNTYYYIADIVWDGTDTRGNYHLRSNGSYNDVPSTATAKYNVSVGTNSITFSSTATSRSSAPGSFYNGTYELTYIY